jgi:hypothetical protein
MDRRTLHKYSLPAAWRGVASPRFLRLARWLSLVEELGGVCGLPREDHVSLGALSGGPGLKAGKSDMDVLTPTPHETQIDMFREFVAEELPRAQRLVLMLHYADGLSTSEIAEVLDLPEATVVRLFHKTMESLQERFG